MKVDNALCMKIAELFALESKAVRKKVGAVLVTTQRVLLPGYNGTPSGWSNACEYKDENDNLVTRPYVLHAETNVILKAAREGVSAVDSTLYITASPCQHCAAIIHQAGISRVFYKEVYKNTDGIDLLISNGWNNYTDTNSSFIRKL